MNKEQLCSMIENGYSTYEIAKETSKCQTTVRYWLNKYGIQTKTKEYKCKFCGETRKEKFVNKGSGRKSYSTCKRCHSLYTIERFRLFKLQSIEYKGGKCNKCGYNKCPGSLEFHHRDPKEKDINWRRMRSWKFEKIKRELDKCDLLCSNCHREIHWGLGEVGIASALHAEDDGFESRSLH